MIKDFIFQSKTSLWWLANILVLVGTAAYSIVKSIDMKNTQKENEAKSNDDVEAKKPLV